MAAPGVYMGHHKAKKIVVNAALAERLNANIQKLGFRPPLDIRHQSSVPFIDAPRRGTLGGVEWRDDGIYATDLQWNEEGREDYQKDRYGYVSWGLLANLKDPRSNHDLGPVMHHLSLTNNPFFGGAAALAEAGGDDEMNVQELIAQIKEDAGARKELLAGLGINAEQANTTTMLDADAIPVVLCERLGLDAGTTVSKAIDELDRREEQTRKDRASSIVQAAIAAGKIPKDPEAEAHKSLLELAESSPDAAERFLSTMTSQVPPKPAGQPAERERTVEISAEQQAFNAELGLTDEDWQKYGEQPAE